MATTLWRGDAPPTADVYTLTVGGSVEIGDIFNGIMNTKTVPKSATTTSLTTTATEFTTAMEASTIPEFEEVTWTSSSAIVTATGPSDGTPVTITASTTESNGGAADTQTFVVAHPTVATGPNDWNNGANWSGAAVPGADVVHLQNSNVDITNGLDQSAASVTTINQWASYTGKIGRPLGSESKEGFYYEYRVTYLTFNDVTTLNIGAGDGGGSSRMKYNTGTNAGCTANIYLTAARKDAGIPALLLKGAHASNVLNLYRGDVGLAYLAGETATWPVIRVLYTKSPASDAQLRCGAGCTLTTITKSAGYMEINSAVTTLTQNGGETNDGNGGTTIIYGSGAITTLTCDKGTVIHNGSGTITTLKVGPGATVDFSQGTAAITVTDHTLTGSGGQIPTILDPKQRVTFTNAGTYIGKFNVDRGVRGSIKYS